MYGRICELLRHFSLIWSMYIQRYLYIKANTVLNICHRFANHLSFMIYNVVLEKSIIHSFWLIRKNVDSYPLKTVSFNVVSTTLVFHFRLTRRWRE